MIDPAQIPDEAVEAAARDMALTEWGDTEMWDVFTKRAESAIAAALNAWPGWEGRTVDGDILRETIILLLPQEKRKTDLRIEMAPKTNGSSST